MIEISQAGGEDVGYYIIEGVNSGCTTPSVVMNADGSMDAFYLYTTGSQNGDIQTHVNGSTHSPWDLHDGPIAQHMVMTTAWSGLKLTNGAGCTWSNDTPTDNGYGGVMTVKLYMWDTDYSTTVAADPVYSNTVYYNDNQQDIELIGSSKFAAGDYLVELSSDKVHSGVWYIPENANGTVEGYEFKGWYTDTEYKNEFLADTEITEDTTIYAYFVELVEDTTPDINNPQTGDNVLVFFLVGLISLIGFVGGSVYFLKHQN